MLQVSINCLAENYIVTGYIVSSNNATCIVQYCTDVSVNTLK